MVLELLGVYEGSISGSIFGHPELKKMKKSLKKYEAIKENEQAESPEMCFACTKNLPKPVLQTWFHKKTWLLFTKNLAGYSRQKK